MRWPNLTLVAVVGLGAELTARVVTRLPAKLEEQVAQHGGVVRVTRGPGSDDKVTDSTLVDVETFTSTAGEDAETAAWDLAEDARQAMHALGGRVVDGALIDSVTTSAAPVYVDYGNPAIFRTVASYRVAMRKIAATD